MDFGAPLLRHVRSFRANVVVRPRMVPDLGLAGFPTVLTRAGAGRRLGCGWSRFSGVPQLFMLSCVFLAAGVGVAYRLVRLCPISHLPVTVVRVRRATALTPQDEKTRRSKSRARVRTAGLSLAL